MLDAVDLSQRIGKPEFKERAEDIDRRLGPLQRQLREAKIPVLIVFEGWDASGKGSVLARILKNLDPRGFKVYTFPSSSGQDHYFPPMFRFWRSLPPYGAMSIYDPGWYQEVFDQQVEKPDEEHTASAWNRINNFERLLSDDRGLVIKFFLHISRKEQSERFAAMEKDPAFAWRVGEAERRRQKKYEQYYTAIGHTLKGTDTADAPWTVVPATSERYATLAISEALSARFEGALADAGGKRRVTKAPSLSKNILDKIDLSGQIAASKYESTMDDLQARVRRLQHLCYVKRKPVVIVYEGWDAAGKGGSIRRMVRDLDPRGYSVISVGAPEGDEKNHHYLWRFWREAPKAGHIAIFDRSWYGRVLVERVEGFAAASEWQRAYGEINEFEGELESHGAIIIKFWIQISKEEQLKRFSAREDDPQKHWKITPDDWRNRKRWDDYAQAASDMIQLTNTAHAPWTIVPGDHKHYARVQTLEVVVKRLESKLGSAR